MAPRWTAVTALALLAFAGASFLPVATAQAPSGAVLVLEDGTGDVETQVGGAPVAGGEAAYPGVDLVGFAMQETPFSVALSIRVAALPKQNDPGADGVEYTVFFTHNGREFRADVQVALPAIDSSAFLSLSYRDVPGAEWSALWFSDEVVVDAAANSLSVDLERTFLVDKDGAAPFPGRSLEGVHVLAKSLFSNANATVFLVPTTFPQSVTDALPDAAPYPALPIQLGLAQTGHARLTSAMPFRASNGEATTFVYNITAHNLADREDTFQLAAQSVPAGYSVVLPVPALAIPAGGKADVPVLLSMPFGHQHGAVASLVLELSSLSDGSAIGRLEIGVRFLAIPQPAGHHDTVFLHQAPQGNGALVPFFAFGAEYMNTLEEDPLDAGGKSYTSGFSSNGNEYEHSWDFPLQPTLQMGLHVDQAKVGHLRLPIGTTVPQNQVKVTARLYAWDERQFTFFEDPDGMVAKAESEPVDLGPSSEHLFELDLLPTEGVGRVPFTPGTNLHLGIEVTHAGPPTLGFASEGLYIGPGSSARLPLQEWHDPVDEVLAALDGPGLSPLGPQERLVNPGEAVVFPLSIANPFAKSKRFDLEVSGPNAGWATLSPDSVEVPANSVAQATVVVRAPTGAVDGDRADLVLQAFPRDDPTSRGLLRLVAEVDTDADQVDDSAIAPTPGKKSPSAGLPVALAALAGLALVRRRRPLL
ncbi:MAG: hypothetical protein ACYC2H_04350 [Thermoplasmatota archaeon]